MKSNIENIADRTKPMATGNEVRRNIGFRTEVVGRNAGHALGATTLAVPLPFLWCSAIAVALIALIVSFLMFGSYTKTELSESVITTQRGVAQVRGQADGVVAEVYVNEGDRVRAGEPLVVLRVEQQVFDAGVQDTEPGVAAAGVPTTESKIIPIKSPTDGMVYQLPFSAGATYSQYQPVAVISAGDSLSVTTQVSALAQSSLRVGDAVPMTLNAYKGAPKSKITGRVASIALSPTDSYTRDTRVVTRTYKVEIAIDSVTQSDRGRELLGKTVSVRLPLRKRQLYQWILDPLKALFGD